MFNIRECILYLAVSALFVVTYYGVILNMLNMYAIRSDNKMEMVANLVESSISNANQVMYSLAVLLAKHPIEENNLDIEKLISSFIPKHEYKAMPFYNIRVLDANNRVIFNALIPQPLFMPSVKAISKKEHLIASKKVPFFLSLGKIELRKDKQEIIPACMSMINDKYAYIGAVCSSLLTKRMLELFNSQVSTLSHNARLMNLSDANNLITRDQIKNVFTITNIVKSYFQNKPLLLIKSLKKYPLAVELEVNYAYLNKELGIMTLSYAICFGLFIVVIYRLLIINRKFYQESFSEIYQKIFGVLVKINPNILEKDNKQFQLNYFDLNHLKWALESIIDYCNITIANIGKQSEVELHNKILHVVLTEHHYTSSNKMLGENIDNLYLEQLRKLVNEDTRTMEVSEFFREVAAYCCEYYNELDLKISIGKRSNKVFMFKHAALIEVIFHIFGLIARIGKFDIENREVILKATFAYKKQFPTISIETNLLESSLKSLGWEAGPSYVYSGLLSIYLLAKENNLFFHIKQKNQKVIFVLESIESEKLKYRNSHLLSSE